MPKPPNKRANRCNETSTYILENMQSHIQIAKTSIHMLDVTTSDFDYEISKIIYQLNKIKRAVDRQHDNVMLEHAKAANKGL
tara:strand:- start:1877 stop:2122 length:246 start_codon:yes stop_codon:yes gene_type:complete